MSTITTTLHPDTDGTLHLPVPAAWRNGPIRVRAELEPASLGGEDRRRAKAGLWKNLPNQFWMAADFDAPLDDFRKYSE